ncbi:MAG: DUF922 domain-containing protein [Pseudomonadota bacterium]
MNKLEIAVLAMLAAAISGCVSTSPDVTTSYYTISGQTSDELDRELRLRGPMQGHAIAVAAIRFNPVAVIQEEAPDGCLFKTAKFRVEAKITLPRWKERNQTRDRDLRRAWDGLARYAKIHEDTHVKIAERFAKLLGEELEEIPAQNDCRTLDRAAKKVVERTRRAHTKAQNAFDAAEQRRLARLFAETS